MTSRSLASAGVLCLLLALTACSDDGGSGENGDGDAQPSGSGSVSGSVAVEAEPYLPVPDGVELTAQGSELAFGDDATVAYELNQDDQVAATEVKVTRVDRATFELFEGWRLEDETLETTPYFVHATVTNVGDTDLGTQPVKLYAVDDQNRLIRPSTFQSVFEPCDGSTYPKKFRTDDTFKACLVYLAPEKGKVTAVSFRPTEAFNPIVWTGEITRPESGDDKKDGTKDGKKKDGNKKGDGNQG